MKALIISALDKAIIKLDDKTPDTKQVIKSIDVSDVYPVNLHKFMKDNNIPDNAFFNGTDNGYDGWDAGTTLLSWEVVIPTTDKDKLFFRKKFFTDIAWKLIYDSLTNNNYKRVGYNTGKLKTFKDTTVYDMYVNKDFDRLVDYYSLPFIPKDLDKS